MRIVAFVGSPVECNEKDVSETLNVLLFTLLCLISLPVNIYLNKQKRHNSGITDVTLLALWGTVNKFVVSFYCL